jgi:hypothetical protein
VAGRSVAYFTAVETEPNTVFDAGPDALHRGDQGQGNADAISPYSMAVAPDSFFRKAVSFWRITPTLLQCPPKSYPWVFNFFEFFSAKRG